MAEIDATKSNSASSVSITSHAEDDAKILSDMGYSQELFRGFSGWVMSFSFCFTAVAVMPSIVTTFGLGLANGGPTELIWTWIVASIFTIITGCAMAEICSTYPSAGSVYHWAGQLAPPKWAPIISYTTGNAAGDASFAWAFANLIYSVLVSEGLYTLSTGQQTGIAIAVAFTWGIVNALRVDQQGWFNNFAMVWQLVCTFIFVVVILSLQGNNHALNSSSFVWTLWNNDSGWQNVDGYVVLIGLLTACFSFSGYEAGAHMAEETKAARVSAPIGVIMTCVASALTGFWFLLGLLYAMPSSRDDYYYDDNGYYHYSDFYNVESGGVVALFYAVGGTSVGQGLGSLAIIAMYFAGVSSLTVTTRIAYAMARDGALPGSTFFRKIYPVIFSPLHTVLLVFISDALLMLLPLGSTTALNAITGTTAICYQISYAIPLFLRVTTARKSFRKGKFHLGPFSEIFTWIAVLWLVVTSIFMFWPAAYPVTYIDSNGNSANFNWTVVVIGGVGVFGALYWVLVARFTFKGPQRRHGDLPPLTAKEMAGIEQGTIEAGGGTLADDFATSRRYVELPTGTTPKSEPTPLATPGGGIGDDDGASPQATETAQLNKSARADAQV